MIAIFEFLMQFWRIIFPVPLYFCAEISFLKCVAQMHVAICHLNQNCANGISHKNTSLLDFVAEDKEFCFDILY